MKIGDRIFVRGYIDEIRKDTVIVRFPIKIGFNDIEKVINEQPTVNTAETDLISRQAALDAVINLWADKPFGNPALVEIKDCIEALPSAQPEHMSWTLCRHQMPENNVNVLFCRVDGEIFVGHHFHLDNYWVTMGYAIPDNDVKAWMPLPEPYKAESEDKE